MTTLSAAEVCSLLHISDSTLRRRVKAGVYKATRTGEGQYAKLVFTYADIGLTEPTPPEEPAVEPQTKPTPEPEPVAEPEPKREPTQADRDAEFAAAYKAGLVPDSCGNYIGNAQVSLLGKQPDLAGTSAESRHAGSTDHMCAALLPKASYDSRGDLIVHAGSDNAPLTARMIERGDINPQRTISLPEQRRKEQQDRLAIALAWRSGFSR